MRDARAGAAQGSGSDDAAAASQRDQAAAAEAEAAGAHEGRGPAAPNADSSGGAAAAAAASGDAASDGLPRGWQAALDPASGLVFYFHSSGLAQWERPRAAGGEGDEGREGDEDAGGADGGSGGGDEREERGFLSRWHSTSLRLVHLGRHGCFGSCCGLFFEPKLVVSPFLCHVPGMGIVAACFCFLSSARPVRRLF